MPSGYGQASAAVQVKRREEENGEVGGGKPTGEAGKQYEKEEKITSCLLLQRYLFAFGDVSEIGMRRETEQ